jgi:hypothetical protein
MERITAWVRTHLGYLVLLALGAFTGAALLRSRTSRISSFEAALELERRKRQIVKLHEQRMRLSPIDTETANEILRLSAEVEKHKQRIVEMHKGVPWDGLSDQDIRAALRDAGL